MKLLKVLLLFILFVSCSGETEMKSETIKLTPDGTRGVSSFEFNGNVVIAEQLKFNFEKSKDATSTLKSIKGRLQTAENKNQLLDVKFHMEDETIKDGIFVFSIESPGHQMLMMEMYDEEGFELTANNKLNVTQGNNYKALNVKDLNSGTYLFKIKDTAGKELTRQVTIAH